MKSLFFASILTFLSSTALGAELLVKCGGTFNKKSIEFKYNEINGVYSAYSDQEELMVFINVSKPHLVEISYGDTLTDADWEKLKTLRSKTDDKDTYDLVTRLGSGRVTRVWAGYTKEGWLHFDVNHRDRHYSFSCQKW